MAGRGGTVIAAGIAMVAALSAILLACSSSASTAVPEGAHAVGGGCGRTRLYTGASPTWTASAGPPVGLVGATAEHGDVAAVLFGYPLRAGHPQDRANKILWIVREPRDGSELTLIGHRLGTDHPSVTYHQPDDSSPGEIYPSIIDVPTPGCWQFTVAWHGHTDEIEIPYS